ncbi:MAG: carboxypeptidase-like regulatory domain-containing protein [Mesonia sp.]|uniref:carboxypeptidase-like regulatory domain-containing protein n=1 Tax=Mesonia sp. TaxID=1960830 RepID=UPI003241EE18
MMNKTLLSILTIACLLFLSCSDDDDFSQINDDQEITDPTEEEPITIDLSENFGNEVSRNFIGQIVDANQNPIPDVAIEIADITTTTDDNGVFILNEASVYENFAYIKASKPGYINGSRALIPTEGINHIRIMLLEKNIAATIESGTSSVVTNENGASVEFDGNFINDETEETYTGNIKVSFHYLNPEDSNMTSQMPGMLYAANAENEERMLQTFGMLAVELEGENGEKLNLAETSGATIRVPLSSALSANAPATIPLWYFDEDKGYWIEEGEATLQGNEYVGTVNHFSFWNCDIPTEAVNYCLTLENEEGEILTNTTVSITSATYGTTYGQTNEEGEVCGLVPMGENLMLEVYYGDYNSDCNDIFYSTEIGPFSQDTTESLTVEVPDELEVSINAIILNCDAELLLEGYVIINGYSSNIIYIENGELSTSFLLCNENYSIELEAINTNSIQSSGNLFYTLTEGNNDLGSISTCETELEEFIQYSIDNGETNFFVSSNIESSFQLSNPNYDSPMLYVYSSTNDFECFYIMGLLNDSPHVGEYGYYNYNSQDQLGFNFSDCLDVGEQTENNIQFQLNSLGEVGQYIDIEFSGDYLDWSGNPHTIVGTVHVLRDE